MERLSEKESEFSAVNKPSEGGNIIESALGLEDATGSGIETRESAAAAAVDHSNDEIQYNDVEASKKALAKADEIAKLIENVQLKTVMDDLRRKINEAEMESLREEYHQRVAALEREIREIEEDTKGLESKLQVEENKIISLKREKAATENLLVETVEKHQAELAALKDYYSNALNAAKEAQALAESHANTARTELERRIREAEYRESMLVETIEELRETVSGKEYRALQRENLLYQLMQDLERRLQASISRCEELEDLDSTRLLRQIEEMQETAARRAEAWTAIERSLYSQIQEAEFKAAAADEKARSIKESLTFNRSRINVLEDKISCHIAQQGQLMRSLENERQRADENLKAYLALKEEADTHEGRVNQLEEEIQRQRAAENSPEYLALKEEADTHKGRVNQLEEEIRQLRRKHREDLCEALLHHELLRTELDLEKAARLDQERASSLHSPRVTDQGSIGRQKSTGFENEGPVSPCNMTSHTYEAALRQKEGELASYISRVASLESIRDSLSEELFKMTVECENFRSEAATLPGIRAELEELGEAHSAALELIGEQDEKLEELRADNVDLKKMYKEQENMLANEIQKLS